MLFLSFAILMFGLPFEFSDPIDPKYLYTDSDQEDSFAGAELNNFMNLVDGNDAVQMGAGNDIVDDGGGSNFLTGGAGRDTFFLDGRFLVPGWSCIANSEDGEALTLRGWTAGVSTAAWSDSHGLPGYLRATMFTDIAGTGLVETAVTWTGTSIADLPAGKEMEVSGIGVLYFS